MWDIMGGAVKDKWPLPASVHLALIKLGKDMKSARRRRRLSMQLVAQRAGISRSTLARMEKGDASVSMGAYAAVLFALGLLNLLRDVVDAGKDSFGGMREL